MACTLRVALGQQLDLYHVIEPPITPSVTVSLRRALTSARWSLDASPALTREREHNSLSSL
jgi:hypothetical protein